jgi:hypothetical protein
MRPAGQAGHGDPTGDVVFDAAVADLYAGRDAQCQLHPQVVFEDVPAPRKLAPYAAAISATVQAAGPGEQPDIGWGRLVLLYDPDGQPGWSGQFRVIAYIRADVEAEIAADPLLGKVSWSWLTEALDARAVGYAVPSGTVTRVVTEGFGGKQGEPPATGLELRASWSPTGPTPTRPAPTADGTRGALAPPALAPPAPAPPVPVPALAPPALAGHVAAWCDALCAAAGLPPAAAGVIVMPRPRRRP